METDALIDEILASEGGFVNHPNDKGGPTNHGITQATLAAYRGRPVTLDDVRNLSATEAREIYLRDYVTGPGFDRIQHPLLRYCVVDFGVNSGTGRAARFLQQVAGVRQDGAVGPITLKAVNALDGERAAVRYIARRMRFVARIVGSNRSQAAFILGWTRRITEPLMEF